jgi:flagellum-specific ATP synthase
MATYAEAEDMIDVGAYRTGSNPAIDEAIAKKRQIDDFLIQGVEEKSSIADTLGALSAITSIEIPPEETASYQMDSRPKI